MSLAFLSFVDMCNFTLLPLMWSTSIPLGGLGLDPLRIGTALGVFGLINAFVQVRIMGPVLRRFGARRVFRVSFSSLLFSLVFFPIMKYFAQRAGRVDGIVVALMVAQLTSQMLLYFAYGTIKSYKSQSQLLTKHASDSGQVLYMFWSWRIYRTACPSA